MWKVAERWWAKWLHGNRVPSQGKSHQDIEGSWFIAEHKYRVWDDYSAEFRKAIDQMDENTTRCPEKVSLLCLSLHKGRGKPTRRFLVFDIQNYGDIDEWLTQLNLVQK